MVNAALAVLALAGIGWAYQTVTASNSSTGTTPGSRERVVAVSQGSVTSTVSASGTVQSGTTANANFVTSGTVTEIDVKVGDVVTKGQLLAKVDPASAQGDLATAKANLTAAQQSLTRANSATTTDAATIATAQAQVTTAQTNVDTAQRAVDGTVLTAPMAGTVTAISGAVGSSSGGGSSSSGSSGSGGTGGGSTGGGTSTTSTSSSSSSSGFIQLADLTSLQIAASFAETDATKLKTGQSATVTWSALSGTRATAKVLTIAPTATTSNNVNTYAVVAQLDTNPTGVRLGQSTTIQVTVAEADNAIRIPTAALRTTGGQSTVLVRTGTKEERRTVVVGIQGDTYVQITSGLASSDQVVIVTAVTASGSARSTTNQGGFGGAAGGGFGGAANPGGGGFGGGR